MLRIAVTAKTPTGASCPAAVFRFTGGNNGQDLVLTPGQYWSDSGATMLTFAAGTTLQATLRTGSTCASNTGADANLLVEYRAQVPGDTTTCSGTLCNGICTTPASDPSNCGTCGTKCPSGVPCTSGNCGSAGCQSGQVLCNGTCTSTQSDPNNCGQCANVCPQGDVCSSGTCAVPSSACVVNGVDLPFGTVISIPPGTCQQNVCDGKGNIISVSDNINVPASTQCATGICSAGVPGFIPAPAGTACTSGAGAGTCDGNGNCVAGCPSGQVLCSGICVNEQTNPSNCGQCGNACFQGETCVGGQCTCPSGQSVCGNACVNETSDPNNCGACGHVCASGLACVNGACGSCPQGQSVCNSACVNEQSDPNNCGQCGNVCAPGETCTSGACSATNGDVVTWHYDNNRSGVNANETTLTPSNVTPTQFGKVGEFAVDGQIDGQVLYVSQLAIPNVGTKNVVYVATENDSVYALDAATISGSNATTLWKTSVLGQGESAATGLACGNINPSGITATPVIDRSRNAIYVVAKSQNGGTYYERIHALSLTTGQELFGGSTTIAATASTSGNGVVTFDPSIQHDRAALLESGGTIYAVWSGLFGDCEKYYGWVIGFNADTLAQTSVLNLDPNDSGAGIWMGGGGPAADAAGSVYVISGNQLGTSTDVPPASYANSFIRLQPAGGLAVADYFAPNNTLAEDGTDSDFGSAAPLLLPNLVDGNYVTHVLAAAAGKDGTINLLDRTNLGGFSSTANNVYQRFQNPQAGPNFSTPIYFNSALYLSPGGTALGAFPIANAKLVTTTPQQTSHSFAGNGSVPTISANATHNGVVWALDKNAETLYAFNAAGLAELYDSSQAAGNRDKFAAVGGSFITPMVANGNVYFGTGSSLATFGLLCGSGGLTSCNGVCVNEHTDPNNCGTCGNTCASGQTCTNGACGCPGGTTSCNNVCVNETSDPNNCGACGHVCATGQACTNGICACPAGQSVCSNACVNEQTDPHNCGACGNVCANGQLCSNGACTTPAPVCGNGIREAGEQCDDGNTTNLDGCSSTCQFEQNQRVTSLALLSSTDAFCGHNELGVSAFTSIALGQFNPSLNASIAAGTANQFFIFTGLTDLTGKSSQSGIQVGMIDGTLASPYTTGFSGSSDLDWWYTFDPNSVNLNNNTPVSQVTASIASSVLTAGPGTINIPNFFGTTPPIWPFFNSTLSVPIGAASAPAESSSGNPPGHLAAEHLDPNLQSFASMGSASGEGKLCGAISATTLAETPAPASLVSGGSTPCAEGYTSSNSMLDVLVSGCTVLFKVINPSQPDTVLSGSSVCPLTVGANHVVNASPACLAQDGYSAYVQFTTDRVIVK